MLLSCFLLLLTSLACVWGQGLVYGQFDLYGYSGVSAMHAALSPTTNKVVFLDRANVYTEVFAKDGNYSWSTEYDITTREYRPLDVRTNTFCSAGGYLPNGTIVSIGGAEASDNVGPGFNSIRFYHPCTDGSCDWTLYPSVKLGTGRWYLAVEALSDGTLFIVGGSNGGTSINSDLLNVPSFELYPPRPDINGIVGLEFLNDTLPYNLYPAVHLLPDGNLFMFASNQAIILSGLNFSVISYLPDLPGEPRSYPLTGGSILLPLNPTNNYTAEVLICGGSSDYSINATAVSTCGRIRPYLDSDWNMEDMPQKRLMPDLLHLADGSILVINGCQKGTAGFGQCTLPTYTPNFYAANNPEGSRWSSGMPSTIARMYHSVALTVLDARVLVAGSNPNGAPTGVGPFPTDYRIEMFTPPFLLTGTPQPVIRYAPTNATYNQTIDVVLTTYTRLPRIQAALQQSGFVTHSTHMSQRYVWLEVIQIGIGNVTIQMPSQMGVAPPAYYMLRIIENGVPSAAVWLQLRAS